MLKDKNKRTTEYWQTIDNQIIEIKEMSDMYLKNLYETYKSNVLLRELKNRGLLWCLNTGKLKREN